jgi:hypothetical protein
VTLTTANPTTDPTTSPTTDPGDGGDDGVDVTGGESTGMGDTTRGSGETDDGRGESSTTAEPDACADPIAIELDAEAAILSGDWEIVMSMFGEGNVAAIDDNAFDPSGTVHWDIDVPCAGDWYIWVRATDFGSDDSFFARLDGEPEPAPIFEIDCGFGGEDYAWRVLNWRDPDTGEPCEYVEDPWIAQWTAGAHAFELDFRESIAVARIVVTNDPAYVP